MVKKIAVLPGDGIGPEIIEEALRVLGSVEKKFKCKFEFTFGDIGAIAIEKTGNPLPKKTVEICVDSDSVLFGAIGDPKYDNNPNAKIRPEQGLLGIRKELGLFCNIRPVKMFESLIESSTLKNEIVRNIDFTIFRELTGGIYFGEKKLSKDKNTASDLCIYSRDEIVRISHEAFRAARDRKNKITLVDKANVMESSRLWRRVVKNLHEKKYKDVNLNYLLVDNAAMQMVINPAQFDVILTSNLFGDIISDIGSVVGGSIGLLPSASVGKKSALFEPIHGSYPEGKNKGIANPIAMILSAALMLKHMKLSGPANSISKAVDLAIQNRKGTRDIFPESNYTTSDVGKYIADNIY